MQVLVGAAAQALTLAGTAATANPASAVRILFFMLKPFPRNSQFRGVDGKEASAQGMKTRRIRATLQLSTTKLDAGNQRSEAG